MVYPALLPLMRTPQLPVVDWTDAPADLNGLVCFAERRNLVSARGPSHFKRSLSMFRSNILPPLRILKMEAARFSDKFWQMYQTTRRHYPEETYERIRSLWWKNRELVGLLLRHHLLKAPKVFTLKGQRRRQECYNQPAARQMRFVRIEYFYTT